MVLQAKVFSFIQYKLKLIRITALLHLLHKYVQRCSRYVHTQLSFYAF